MSWESLVLIAAMLPMATALQKTGGAASTAFSTPIASPVNTLVLAPGDYRFVDYARAGVLLQILVLTICVLVVPLLLPF